MYKWIILSLVILGCKPSAKSINRNYNEPGIVYQLPASVTELLGNKIKGHEDSLYFELNRDSIYFTVSILEIHKKFPKYRWIICSNHQLKIGTSLFPLLLPYDRDYGVSQTPSDILILANSYKYFSFTMLLEVGEPYYVKFDSKGKIIFAGR